MIDVWYVDLSETPTSTCDNKLSLDEIERGARIRHEAARLRWLRSRIALRAILAGVVDCCPGEVRFEYGPYGKPMLAVTRTGASSVHFSLSRSYNLSVIAVCDSLPVGVDIERIASVGDLERIAAQFFSPDEVAALRELPDKHRLHAFLTAWTQREAYAKAIGVGLQMPLRDLQTSIDATHLQATQPFGRRDSGAWRLAALQPAEGYVGALTFRDSFDVCSRAIWQKTYPTGGRNPRAGNPLQVESNRRRDVWWEK